MTRRVRFTPLVRAGVFAAGGLLASDGSSRAGDVPFATQPPISTTAAGAIAVFAADVDGDGDLDALSASILDDTIAWYENTAGNGSAWTLHAISTSASVPEAVVTELTGNASGQAPNRFQVTHLGTGPSASAAEDRTYDIPLRPACPADVTAAVGPITPVELLGFTVE